MMTSRRDKGIGLLIVLGVLAVMGAAIAAMTAQATAIAYETHRMQSQARVRDLEASASAWAKRNLSPAAGNAAGNEPALSAPKVLDVTDLGIPGALLSVQALAADANGTAVLVTCQCGPKDRTTWGEKRLVVRPPAERR